MKQLGISCTVFHTNGHGKPLRLVLHFKAETVPNHSVSTRSGMQSVTSKYRRFNELLAALEQEVRILSTRILQRLRAQLAWRICQFHTLQHTPCNHLVAKPLKQPVKCQSKVDLRWQVNSLLKRTFVIRGRLSRGDSKHGFYRTTSIPRSHSACLNTICWIVTSVWLQTFPSLLEGRQAGRPEDRTGPTGFTLYMKLWNTVIQPLLLFLVFQHFSEKEHVRGNKTNKSCFKNCLFPHKLWGILTL